MQLGLQESTSQQGKNMTTCDSCDSYFKMLLEAACDNIWAAFRQGEAREGSVSTSVCVCVCVRQQ